MSNFPNTMWTRLIHLAAKGTGNGGESLSQTECAEAKQALEQLCQLYRYPVYVYLRGRVRSPEEAEDLTQECFLKLFELGWLGKADRKQGKFRTFLLDHVDGLVSDHFKRKNAKKRGGGVDPLPLDFEKAAERFEEQFANATDPARAYDLAWAEQVMDRTMQLLEQDYARRHADVPFSELRGHLPGGGCVRQPYADIARRYPGVSVNSLEVRVCRLKDRLPEVLRSVLSAATTDPILAEEEYRYFVQLVLGT